MLKLRPNALVRWTIGLIILRWFSAVHSWLGEFWQSSSTRSGSGIYMRRRHPKGGEEGGGGGGGGGGGVYKPDRYVPPQRV